MSHNLTYMRRYHGSWNTSEGLMLVGSYNSRHDEDSENTTEILTEDGFSEEGYSLDYIGRLVAILLRAIDKVLTCFHF